MNMAVCRAPSLAQCLSYEHMFGEEICTSTSKPVRYENFMSFHCYCPLNYYNYSLFEGCLHYLVLDTMYEVKFRVKHSPPSPPPCALSGFPAQGTF